MLAPGSRWQVSPIWLRLSQAEWPVTPINFYKTPNEDICDHSSNYYKKSGQTFVAALTNESAWGGKKAALVKSIGGFPGCLPPAQDAYSQFDRLMDSCSSLQKLV